ncbi:MAG: hypothetical protein Q8P41_14385 [Pseudomonadota bacterium]|nr:hypothetical protein [Pseudomonadota bacterium]
MPGDVYRGAEAEVAASWKDGTLYDRDGVTPLLTRKGKGWTAGRESAPAWRQQGNVIQRGGSSETFCRFVQDQVMKGSSYDLLYRIVGDKLTRANGREVVARGTGLTPEELVLAGLVFDKA